MIQGASQVLATLTHHLWTSSPQYPRQSWGNGLTLVSATGLQAATNLLPGQWEGGLEQLNQVREGVETRRNLLFFRVLQCGNNVLQRTVKCWVWERSLNRDYKHGRKETRRASCILLFSDAMCWRTELHSFNDNFIIQYFNNWPLVRHYPHTALAVTRNNPAQCKMLKRARLSEAKVWVELRRGAATSRSEKRFYNMTTNQLRFGMDAEHNY